MIRSLCFLGLGCALGLLACNGEVDSTSGDDVGESDVTGVQDLTAMESALGLVKDVKGPNGWKRVAAKVRAGGCYQRTILSPDGANYEFRRYTQGAAFFHKLGTAPATGDDRPVVCVDVDITDAQNHSYTAAYGRYEIDLAMRYGLGREDGAGIATDEPTPSFITYFLNGQLVAGATAAGPNVVDGIDTPLFHGRPFQSAFVLDKGGFSSELARFVWQYAWKSAKAADVFTLADDPVGKLLSVDIGPKLDIPPGFVGDGALVDFGFFARVQHLRFARVDAHLVRTPATAQAHGSENLYLTPKLSDDKLDERAVASCTRPLDAHLKPTGKFVCSGLP